MQDDSPDYITVQDACAIVGGTKPINAATYYRGVKAGRYPKPEHVSAQLVRIRRSKLIEALNRGARPTTDTTTAATTLTATVKPAAGGAK